MKAQTVSAARVWGSGGQHTAQSQGVEEQDSEATGRSNKTEQEYHLRVPNGRIRRGLGVLKTILNTES